MKNLLTFILLIIPFIGITQTTISDKKSKEIDDFVDFIMKERKIPGLALAITHKGRVLKKETYGLASIEYNVPVSDSTVFWIASISKHFVATAIMQLYEKGVIELDTGIHEYLPDAPMNWKGVTVRHLMTHTSGIPSSSTASDLGNRSARGTLSAVQMYENAKNDTLMYAPGEDFLYSDEGIFLLGYIIHIVSGVSFNEYMEENIFKPSGMKTAYLKNKFKIHPNQATGYAKRDGEVIPDRNSFRLIDTELSPAGGIYATIDDMIQWERAMLNNVHLTQKSKDLMWTSYMLNNGFLTFYGFCWNAQVYQGRRVVYHPGVAGTEYMRFVDDSLSIIILTNQAKNAGAIAQKMAKIIGFAPVIAAGDIKTGTASEHQPGKKEKQMLVGQYKLVPNENYYLSGDISMDIVMHENELWLEYPAKQPYRKKEKLAKMDNGRWIQLTWESAFVETSFQIVRRGNRISFKVYEDYNLGYDILVGELRTLND